MRLSWNEVRANAAGFAREWADARYEKGETQSFYNEFFEVEPNIDPANLAKVTAPTLVISGDEDMVRLEHTVQIYESLPNANLAVIPNSTHLVPYDDPQTFNAVVEKFLNAPFKKKDRIADAMTSLRKAMAEAAK